MVGWTRSRWGAIDLEMWEHEAEALPATFPLRPVAEAEVTRLTSAPSSAADRGSAPDRPATGGQPPPPPSVPGGTCPPAKPGSWVSLGW